MGLINRDLDECLNDVVEYHKGIANGMKKLHQNPSVEKVEIDPAEYSPKESIVRFKLIDGPENIETYEWLAKYGNNYSIL